MTDPSPTTAEDLNVTLRHLATQLARPSARAGQDLAQAMADWLHVHHPALTQRPHYYALHLATDHLAGRPITPAEPFAYIHHRDNYYRHLSDSSPLGPRL